MFDPSIPDDPSIKSPADRYLRIGPGREALRQALGLYDDQLDDAIGTWAESYDRAFGAERLRLRGVNSEAVAVWFATALGKPTKASERLRSFVLPTLGAAEARGCWAPKESRAVKAALNKQSAATSMARIEEQARNGGDGHTNVLEDLRDPADTRALGGGYRLNSAMLYGKVEEAPGLVAVAAALAPHCHTDRERDALATASRWARDLAPIGALIAELDARRPKPVLVMKTLSRAVVANLGARMGLDLSTIETPKMVSRWKKAKHPKAGKEVVVTWIEILWPEGTEHGRSRFAGVSPAGNEQCHACGHAIRDAWNWWPLFARGADAKPYSLWVGRDCAAKLFGAEIEGDAVFAERVGGPA